MIEDHCPNKRARERRARNLARKELAEVAYGILAESGPCTARDVYYRMNDPWGKITVRHVSQAITELRVQGRVAAVSKTNDTIIWGVKE